MGYEQADCQKKVTSIHTRTIWERPIYQKKESNWNVKEDATVNIEEATHK